MKYSEEFKKRVFYTLSDSNNLDLIMRAMDKNDHDTVRICLSDAVDDIKLYRVDEVEKDGSPKVRDKMKRIYEDRRELYNDFMIGYDKYLHAISHRSGKKLIHD